MTCVDTNAIAWQCRFGLRCKEVTSNLTLWCVPPAVQAEIPGALGSREFLVLEGRGRCWQRNAGFSLSAGVLWIGGADEHPLVQASPHGDLVLLEMAADLPNAPLPEVREAARPWSTASPRPSMSEEPSLPQADLAERVTEDMRDAPLPFVAHLGKHRE